ncbi:hypothetical protein BDB00DRAFT_837809 [Zychaea mexicana]|uniref:uncharacterized protein n=1 Tax=Zychaea mexicana TaxID=64656 RepID=UPI0022FE7941|nr:uncharacterized protein BDB00DRAFT_837809 [Zychaea mexicana]KAI9490431.1 hypothetical protein BDB00DRAFT_837809 [Zychaea mexicana]
MADPVIAESPRLYVDLKNQSFPIIFSYRELLKRRNREQARGVPIGSTNEEDEYFQSLLARAAQYDTNEGDDIEDNDTEDESAGADKTKRVYEDYDYDDPFIDDSEMLVDEPAQANPLPEYDGFFVYHGQLDGNDLPGAKKQQQQAKAAVTKKKTTQAKPKEKSTSSKKDKPTPKKQSSTTTSTQQQPSQLTSSKPSDAIVPSISTGTASSSSKELSTTTTTTATASKERKPSPTPTVSNDPASIITESAAPVPVSSREDISTTPGGAAVVLKKSATPSRTTETDKKTKASTSSNELLPLSPEIQTKVDRLRKLAVSESFENKAKFPPALRPITLDIGRIMFREENELDSNVVGHLMKILPYNRFTLNKFLTTKSGPERIKELNEENELLIAELKAMVDSQFPEQLQQYNEKLAAATAADAAANLLAPRQEAEDTPHAGGCVEDVVAQKKYKFNDDGRKLLHKILNNDQASNLLSNEILKYQQKEDEMVTEARARKQIYLKLLPYFPPGWMTTIEMSRQNSQYKAKIDKQNNRPTHASSVKKYAPLKEQKRLVITETNTRSPAHDVLPQKREREPSLESSSLAKRQTVVFDSPPRMDGNNAVSPVNHGADQSPSSAMPWDRPESMMIKSLISDNKSG